MLYLIKGTQLGGNAVPVCGVHREQLVRLGPEAFNSQHDANVYAVARRLLEEWQREHPGETIA